MPTRSIRAKVKPNIAGSRKRLYRAFLSLKTEMECANFLRDVATLGEIDALAERLEVARLLMRGATYRAVSSETGVALQTVTRVAHWLQHGQGGYRTVLERLKK